MDPIEQLWQQALVVRSQLGDRGALEQLFLRHHEALGYYLRRMLDRDDAQEAQQEVWLSVLRGIGRLRDPRAFVVWLYQIARSKALNRLSARDRAILLDADEIAAADGDASFDPEDAARIHQELARLSPKHREVLLLRFMDELTYDEIAEVIGCTSGTVRSRLHYAKLALRQRLEAPHDGFADA